MKLLFFAQAAQQAGVREETWDLEKPLSIAEFWTELDQRHPGMASLRTISRIACNCEFIGKSALIQPGDEVAIIPPVSGG